MTLGFILLTIFLMGLVTYGVKWLPFYTVAFVKDNKMIEVLGQLLPPAIMAILVMYCLFLIDYQKTSSIAANYIALGVVVALHLKWRNTLISMIGGLIVYAVLLHWL